MVKSSYSYKLNGLVIKTGDLICTTDGGTGSLSGQFWNVVGKLIPGDVDHVVIYIGPGGRCVEAGATGKVITFNADDNNWDGELMKKRRGFVDTLYGAAYPLKNLKKPEEKKEKIRISVANYCLKQAKEKKPYNINFFNSKTEKAFYCSQLAYKAYLKHGIDLNTGKGVPKIPFTGSIIYPQEIWSGCATKKV